MKLAHEIDVSMLTAQDFDNLIDVFYAYVHNNYADEFGKLASIIVENGNITLEDEAGLNAIMDDDGKLIDVIKGDDYEYQITVES